MGTYIMKRKKQLTKGRRFSILPLRWQHQQQLTICQEVWLALRLGWYKTPSPQGRIVAAFPNKTLGAVQVDSEPEQTVGTQLLYEYTGNEAKVNYKLKKFVGGEMR